MTIRLPKVAQGYKRSFVECSDCGRAYYRDYVPYSLSRPIMTLGCGHDARATVAINSATARRKMAEHQKARGSK